MNLIVSSIGQGLLWSVLGIGIFMTYRILNFPDLTTEGSFPLGSAVAVTAIVSGVHPILATLLAIFAGMLAGLVTGLLFTKCGIPVILSGILVMSALNAVMLFVMGRPNVSLLNHQRLYDIFSDLPVYFDRVLIGIIVVAIVILLLLFFFYTNLGQAYIATGDNETMARSFGIKTVRMKILGLVLSNGVIALSGALVAQHNGYADVNSGLGVIVIGLASIIIGEVVFSDVSLGERLLAIVVGSILYQLLLLFVIQLGLDTTYIRMYSSIVLAICLTVPSIQSKLNLRVQSDKEE